MRLAQFTAACHKGGIGPGEIEAIQIIDDRAVFVGAMVGFAEVDMNKRPTIEQSVEQAQVFDQQQAMEMNQRAQEMQQSQGMSMSM
jgi:stage III sporulation protein SpoIIIAA